MTATTPKERLWHYSVLPAAILNLGGLIVYGLLFGLAGARGAAPTQAEISGAQFGLYVLVFVVEWALAIALVLRERHAGRSLSALIAPQGGLWRFRPWPAVALFLAFNGLFGAYVALYATLGPGWPSLATLPLWQRLFVQIAVPIQAAFCEELIWRGHLIPALERRGRGPRAAVALSALSFALIHGVFLPDKLLVTFVMGLVAGVYYLRERHLAPLMIAHWVVDVWSFALSLWR
jgi:membrane protease YdiL (CAAX protease family)